MQDHRSQEKLHDKDLYDVDKSNRDYLKTVFFCVT